MSDPAAEGSFEVSGTFDGFFPVPPIVPPRQLTYIVPRRRPRWWRRWEIVEYTGQVVPGATTEVDGGGLSVSFTTTGPLTMRVHAGRFWLLRRANRYIRRLWQERT